MCRINSSCLKLHKIKIKEQKRHETYQNNPNSMSIIQNNSIRDLQKSQDTIFEENKRRRPCAEGK